MGLAIGCLSCKAQNGMIYLDYGAKKNRKDKKSNRSKKKVKRSLSSMRRRNTRTWKTNEDTSDEMERSMMSRWKLEQLLVQAEEAYLRRLHIMEACYRVPIARLRPDVVGTEEIHVMFASIDRIQKLHIHNIENIKKHRFAKSERMAKTVEKTAEDYQAYHHYALGLVKGLETLCQLLDKEPFQEFLRAQLLEEATMLSEGETIEGLAYYLLLPISHISDVVELIYGLVEHTISESDEYKNVCIAYGKVKMVSEWVNRSVPAIHKITSQIADKLTILGLEPVQLLGTSDEPDSFDLYKESKAKPENFVEAKNQKGGEGDGSTPSPRSVAQEGVRQVNDNARKPRRDIGCESGVKGVENAKRHNKQPQAKLEGPLPSVDHNYQQHPHQHPKKHPFSWFSKLFSPGTSPSRDKSVLAGSEAVSASGSPSPPKRELIRVPESKGSLSSKEILDELGLEFDDYEEDRKHADIDKDELFYLPDLNHLYDDNDAEKVPPDSKYHTESPSVYLERFYLSGSPAFRNNLDTKHNPGNFRHGLGISSSSPNLMNKTSMGTGRDNRGKASRHNRARSTAEEERSRRVRFAFDPISKIKPQKPEDSYTHLSIGARPGKENSRDIYKEDDVVQKGHRNMSYDMQHILIEAFRDVDHSGQGLIDMAQAVSYVVEILSQINNSYGDKKGVKSLGDVQEKAMSMFQCIGNDHGGMINEKQWVKLFENLGTHECSDGRLEDAIGHVLGSC